MTVNGAGANHQYQIQSGDTLWRIVSRELEAQTGQKPTNAEIWAGIHAVADANNIADPNRIFTGNTLNLGVLWPEPEDDGTAGLDTFEASGASGAQAPQPQTQSTGAPLVPSTYIDNFVDTQTHIQSGLHHNGLGIDWGSRGNFDQIFNTQIHPRNPIGGDYLGTERHDNSGRYIDNPSLDEGRFIHILSWISPTLDETVARNLFRQRADDNGMLSEQAFKDILFNLNSHATALFPNR